MNEEVKETQVFIPLIPNRKMRLVAMISEALPGLVLTLAAFDGPRVTVLDVLLNGFSFLSGLLIIFFSVKAYKQQGNNKKFDTDIISVLSGFMVIAQGTQMFDAVKEFQPAHLYFLAGAIFIFKGVMLPVKKTRKGFTISENSIEYKAAPLQSKITLERKGLAEVSNSGNKLNFSYSSGEVSTLYLRGTENPSALVSELKANLF